MQRYANLMAGTLACLMLCAVAAPASARESQPRAQRVSFADLNLSSETGARAMLGRINMAARVACGDRHGPMPLAERRAVRTCVADATSEAVSALDRPVVTALFNGAAPAITLASR